ncbi:MAG: DUF21 domain-containing protein [Phaeodactylibacter sp.]|nr:DUF21 domain-containing protein [Phaeodactylibacter sp.]
MTLLILFFLFSILFSFLCSIWEAVLLSIPPATVEVEYQKGTRTGTLLKQFKDNIDRPLAAILTLNTLAHTVGAIGVGSEASHQYGDDGSGTFVVSALMTLAILILSEIIPKTLGANYWSSLIGFTVRSVNVVILILYPLVWLSQLLTKLLKKDKEKSVLSRTDFSVMAEIGEKQGVFEQSESKIIQNLLRFNTIRAQDVMTPRIVVTVADEDTTVQQFYDAYPDLRFSRIPTFQDNKDHITGFFLKDDMLTQLVKGKGDTPLSELRRPILYVPNDMDLPDLFNHLMEKREHIAAVVGEFGGFNGLVTMEDVIETLLGTEIMDELDNIEDMQTLARKNWEMRAGRIGLLDKIDKAAEKGGDKAK